MPYPEKLYAPCQLTLAGNKHNQLTCRAYDHQQQPNPKQEVLPPCLRPNVIGILLKGATINHDQMNQ
jgi:hypothetical protein